MFDDNSLHFKIQKINLPNETLLKMGIYESTYKWPSLGCFDFQGSFSISEPWEGGAKGKFYKESRRTYDQLLSILNPYENIWVQAHCTAALVPSVDKKTFAVFVNGACLNDELYRSSGLFRRFALNKIPIGVTVCDARIEGGGLLRNGEKRGYSVLLDLKKFSS